MSKKRDNKTQKNKMKKIRKMPKVPQNGKIKAQKNFEKSKGRNLKMSSKCRKISKSI